jgi:hypothetical protein
MCFWWDGGVHFCVDTAGLWTSFWSLGSKGQKEPARRPLWDNKKLMWICLITFCH